MTEKYRYIEELFGKTLKELSGRDRWFDYLRSAAHLYKYSFRESLLVFAQRPDATAVASYDLWNNKMRRYVNRGSKGIALIDRQSNTPHLHYVFDISDTNGAKMPYIWEYNEAYADRISTELAESFDLENPTDTIHAAIEAIASGLIENSLPELMTELKYAKEKSYMADLDELNLAVMLRDTLRDSVLATVMFRCHMDVRNDSDQLSHLYNFNTPETMILLGTAVSDISETVLREIELSVKTIERENRKRERSQGYGNELQRSGRPTISRAGDSGTDRRAADEVRSYEERSSGAASPDTVQPAYHDRSAVFPLQGRGAADAGADEPADRADESADAEAALADNDSGDRERAGAGADPDKIIEQDAIDTILLRGSHVAGGKQRIIDFFFANPANKDRAAFLKKEYGIGGGTVYFAENRRGFEDYGGKGIRISGFKDEPINLTWSNVARRVGELIDNERYFEPRHPTDKPLIKPTIDINIETKGADEAPFVMEAEDTALPGQKKRRTQSQMNFARLQTLAPHIMDKRYRHATLSADGFMDLSIEWIGEDRLAIAHYGEQNGDLMADPDMELIVNFDRQEVLPATYQNDYLGVFQEIYLEGNRWRPKLSRELTSFLNTWLRNLEFQGHVLAKASYYDPDKEALPILFDEQGREYGLDIPHDLFSATQLRPQSEKEESAAPSGAGYELGYGRLGNGTTVWNRLHEVNGDYETIAHIADDGAIKYYRDDLPPDVRQRIENQARLQSGQSPSRTEEASTQAESEQLSAFSFEEDPLADVDPAAIRERLAEAGIVNGELVDPEKLDNDSFIRQVMVDAERAARNEPPVISDQAISRTGDTITIGSGEASREIDITVSDDEWEHIRQTIPEAPRLKVGMTFTLEERTYRVEEIDTERDRIQLEDITFSNGVGFPIFRADRLSAIERQLERDGFLDAAPIPEESKPGGRPRHSGVSYPGEIVLVEHHIAPPEPSKLNYHITDDALGVGGAKEKYHRNIAAIRLMKRIESENRLATADEQEVLAQYVGWGGLAKAFDDVDTAWSNEYAELKELLDDSEYRTARASTLNAHYTSPVVIKAMYSALESMGFSGGNILEPACGVGNFLGLLPPSLSESNLYGVEIDSVSGRIAQQLYQRESIQITGFEHTAFQDNFFDVVVGNVPFGAYGVSDKRYDKYNFYIHDYFIAKSLDKVRPGGIMALITSKGTLDKQNSSVRKYIAQRAELVGAVRLPNNTFKANAGTEVTCDILFLKKRDSLQDIEPEWVQLGETADGIPINQYYIDNPHMVLGKMMHWKGMYGNENETACVPFEGEDLVQQLADAISHIDAEIDDGYMMDEPDDNDTSIPADPSVKNYSFAIVNDKLYYRENARMRLYDTNATTEKRIRGMLALAKTLHGLIDMQLEGRGDFEIRKAQSRLNSQYDEFISEYGRINNRANRLAFSDDRDYYLLSSLEDTDEDGNFKGKADIFTKQTIRPRKVISHVDTSAEALAVSIGEKARVDIGYMSALTGKEPETVISELQGVIFKNPLSVLNNPYDGYITADEYLSGNVREKLKTAKLIADKHPEFAHHVPALEAVQPEDLEAADIEVKLGTVWIPSEYIDEFIYGLLDTSYYAKHNIKVSYSKYTGAWYVSNKSIDAGSIAARETYGTERISAYQIIEETLNQKNVRITDKVVQPDGSEQYVVNSKETFLAMQKQNLIRDAFRDWIFRDEDRRKHLVGYYNEHFNNIRPREYNGDHLVFEGMNPTLELRAHQRNAVARQLYGGNTLLAHCVGAGKSFTMIAAAMEAKRLGLSSKSMIAVPNHLTEQIAAETLRLYPAAKVLVTTKKDFQQHNRKRFCSKIATGDYDIVIIGHSQFEKIPLSTERQIRTLEREIDEIAYAIENERRYGAQSFNVKQMERTKKALELKLKQLNDQSRKDDVVTFEELGIDRLFVDEAHQHKNLFVVTKMRNVAGVQQTQAQKAMDMYMKCRYMDEITGGRGITFATGTPVSNSMVEMFTMQRYLQRHMLEQRDLLHFDNWASVFGEAQAAYEVAPEGNRFRMKTRFNRFYNLPELMSMFKETADIQTRDMLDLPIPKLKGGKIQTIVTKPTDIQRKMISELGDRADAVRDGQVDPSDDNMLVITNDGRKIALDQRLANPCLPDDPNSKVNALMRNVYDIWKREADTKGAQIVFCDLSTPKFNGEFNVYEDLKKKWMEKGIPAGQIAFIHEAKNEKQKAAMFAKVRSGEIRIILGSTYMMGSGVNIQDRLKAVHHADVGWRPADMEQRDGRILRQGNTYAEVEIYRYITEGTFDSYSWQLLEQKQRFISQVMTSKSPVRSMDDIDEAVLSYAEVKALAAGNPLIKERMELATEVSKLRILKAEHKNRGYRLQEQISTRLPEQIRALELRIKGYTADLQTATSFNGTDFEMTLNGTAYDEKKAAGELLLVFAKQVHQLKGQVIGKYKGFDMAIGTESLLRSEPYVELRGAVTHSVYLGNDAIGNISRLDNAINAFAPNLDSLRHDLESANVQLESAKKEVGKPFAQEFELRQKTARLQELTHELAMDAKDTAMEIGGDDAPEETIADMER